MILSSIKRNLKHFRTSGHFGIVSIAIVIVIFGLNFGRISHDSVPKLKNKEKIIAKTNIYGSQKIGKMYIITVPNNVIITNDPYEVEVANACLSSAGILGGDAPATNDETQLFLEAYEMYSGKKFGE